MPPPGPPGPMNEATLQLLQTSRPLIGEVSEPNQLLQKGQARGSWQALVILIDFPDYRWDHQEDPNFPNQDTLFTTEHFNDMLFSLWTYKDPRSQSGYTGSMRDFYLENSYGQFELTGVTTVWYTASQPMSYYANHDGVDGTSDDNGFGPYPFNARRLVEEAVQLADADVDYSQFDNSGDGFVDALFVVHAGPGAEQIYTQNFPDHYNYLWSHKSSIPAVTLDGVKVSGYTLEPENGTIGVFCHEFGHELGLPDLYDPDGSSEGIGEWCLMASGGWCYRRGDQLGTGPAHFSSWSKDRLGWLEPINITENLVGLEIPPLASAPVAYRVWRNGEIGSEYFLLENRQPIGFDTGLTRRQKDFNLPEASGLIIYHIDNLGRQNDENRRLIDVEEASPFFQNGEYIEQLDLQRIPPQHQFLFNGNRGDNGDPFPGFSLVNAEATDYLGERDLNVFDGNSIPNSNDNNGAATGVAVSNIHQNEENTVVDITIDGLTSVGEDIGPTILPSVSALAQNYPNPFNPSTEIQFSVPISEKSGVEVEIGIYNLRGELIRTLVHEHILPGVYRVVWDGTNNYGQEAASGLYVYRLKTQLFSDARKMVLLR
jgi:immune inhibitor A